MSDPEFRPREFRVSIDLRGNTFTRANVLEEVATILDGLAEDVVNRETLTTSIYPLHDERGDRCGYAVFVKEDAPVWGFTAPTACPATA